MSWFSKLFKKEPVLEPADLSRLKTDLHSHLIPAIDDGSKSLDDSINMIRAFKEMGYQKIITTPHVMSDFYKNTPEIILGGLEKVKAELERQNIEIEIEAAAEYYLDETLEPQVKGGKLLTFGKNYLLFELPFIAEPLNLASFIFELQTNGYVPILAHPERYGFYYKEFDKYRDLKEKGVHLQLNILSLVGHYGPEAQKIAERLIDEGLISFLGSDCHNTMHQQGIEIARTKPYFHKLLNSDKLKNAEL
ncbi:MAG: tyrosine-protein phosphatase YwqE [Vicingaceae bacterium]|jgi:tyrosine-protein phosphatase YwqE